MKREEAFDLVRLNLKSDNLFYHSLAVEAVMRKLAERLGEDAETWALTGLLHDIDYEQTAEEPEKHGIYAQDILSIYKLHDDVLHAIASHNVMTGVERKTLIDQALYAADPVTGLLTACALVKPSKKLSDVAVSSVKKKFKDKAFARGANRAQIDSCMDFNIERTEFLALALESMQEISNEIGL